MLGILQRFFIKLLETTPLPSLMNRHLMTLQGSLVLSQIIGSRLKKTYFIRHKK